MANKFTMMANSALSDQIKRSTITNEARRRLLCCSSNLDEQVRIEVMEDFAMTLRRSGYSERFRHEAFSDAVRSHHKMVETEAAGGRPVDRPKEFQPQERRGRRRGRGPTGSSPGARPLGRGYLLSLQPQTVSWQKS